MKWRKVTKAEREAEAKRKKDEAKHLRRNTWTDWTPVFFLIPYQHGKYRYWLRCYERRHYDQWGDSDDYQVLGSLAEVAAFKLTDGKSDGTSNK